MMLFPIMQVKDSGSLIVIKHHMPEFWYDIYIMARIARLASNSSFMICLNNVVLLQHSRRVCDIMMSQLGSIAYRNCNFSQK